MQKLEGIIKTSKTTPKPDKIALKKRSFGEQHHSTWKDTSKNKPTLLKFFILRIWRTIAPSDSKRTIW
jgi:hypothetical protein